jgi:hypothetical protein
MTTANNADLNLFIKGAWRGGEGLDGCYVTKASHQA